jgi:hypothetical protein
MSEPELLFFQKLGSIVGRSPRAVKRFINLYRILKASHRRARVVGFSEENGDFKVPLFLLAVVCGSPKEAEVLFQCFTSAEDTSIVSAILTNNEARRIFYRHFHQSKDDAVIKTTLAQLKKAKEIPDDFKVMDEDKIISSIREFQGNDQETQGWRSLNQALTASIDTIGNFEIKAIKEWIPVVARFSYREWVE